MDTDPLTIVPLSSGSPPSGRVGGAASPAPLPAVRPARGLSAAGPRNGFRFHDQAGPVHPGVIGTDADGDVAADIGAGSRTSIDGDGAGASAGAEPAPEPISRYPTKRSATAASAAATLLSPIHSRTGFTA